MPFTHPPRMPHHVRRERLELALKITAVLLLLLIFLHGHGWAQGVKPTGQNVQHMICDAGCGGAVGTQAVNVSQYNGLAVGAANPFYVTPGTGALFTVQQSVGTNLHMTLDNSAIAVTQSGLWTVSGSGSFTVAQATGTNLHMVVDSGTVTANQGGTWTMQPGNTANTTAWLVTGTGGIFPATQSGTWTMQPGNTANTTPWLVTASDPTQTGATVALGALNAACSVSLKGNAGAGMFLATGTLIGTIVPEISYDGGSNWFASIFFDAVHNTVVPSVVFTASNTATALTVMAGNGATDMRARVSAFTSGTANCTMRATNSDAQLVVTTGIDGKKSTYRAAFTGQACVASGTAPCATIYGSSTKTLRITHIKATATAATAALEALQAIKFSTAASAGTSAAMAAVPLDSNYSATTATGLLKYTAAPTAGTAVGAVCSYRGLAGSATVTGNVVMECNFGAYPGGGAVVLRGTSQGIGLIVTVAATVDFEAEWTEE